MNEKVGLSSNRGDEWSSQTASKEKSRLTMQGGRGLNEASSFLRNRARALEETTDMKALGPMGIDK